MKRAALQWEYAKLHRLPVTFYIPHLLLCLSVSREPLRQKDTLICLSLTITSSLSVTKEYLKSLGNSECSPQTFLENSSSLDKLLIIIKNEDIAAHVHKVIQLI